MIALAAPAEAADAAWAFRVGNGSGDRATSVAVDSNGNSYVGGEFREVVDFDPGSLTSKLAAQGDTDGFVASYAPGGALRWAFALGSTGQDDIRQVITSGKFLYVVGDFAATIDLDPGPGLRRHTSKGSLDGFILKVRRSDGSYVWGGPIGGTGQDLVSGVAVDGSGKVLITGSFSQSADLDPSPATHSQASAGLGDVFITKLNADGSLRWIRRVGGSGWDEASGIDTDASNNIFAGGYYTGTVDFRPGTGTDTHTSNGSTDMFVLKLSPVGTHIWARTVGGSLTDYGQALVSLPTGGSYLLGTFQGTVDFKPGTGTQNRTSNGGYDVVVLRLKADGTFSWVATAGSAVSENGIGIALEGDGQVHATGNFGGTADFDPSGAIFNLAPVAEADAFVWTLAANGTFLSAWKVGGTGTDSGFAIDVRGSSVWVAGSFTESGDFDPGAAVRTLTSAGDSDVFVVRAAE